MTDHISGLTRCPTCYGAGVVEPAVARDVEALRDEVDKLRRALVDVWDATEDAHELDYTERMLPHKQTVDEARQALETKS